MAERGDSNCRYRFLYSRSATFEGDLLRCVEPVEEPKSRSRARSREPPPQPCHRRAPLSRGRGIFSSLTISQTWRTSSERLLEKIGQDVPVAYGGDAGRSRDAAPAASPGRA